MSWPPPYPRVPHLLPAPAAARDDLVLDEEAASAMLSEPVIVEEKLDGANVMLWWDGDRVQAATRGGPGARDRGGQLGPLRAWAAERAARLRPALSNDSVVYGEWLWLRHSVPYDALPDALVAFDLLSSRDGFASVVERDRICAHAGLAPPPRLFSGVLGTRERLDELFTISRYGSGPAEGLILRPIDAASARWRIAKVVADCFSPRTDESWHGKPERNALSP